MNPSPMAAAAAHSSHLSEKPNPNHPVTCLRTLPGSYIKIYKNGVLMGTAFEDLLSFLPPASTPNSKLQEGAREGFDDGTLGYYPAVSVFRGGAAEVNFGPDFWYPPPGYQAAAAPPDGDVDMADADQETPTPSVRLRPVAERFDEQIVEDVLCDIVDEVDFWMQDGGKVVDKTMPDVEGREAMQED
ncbi:SET1 complex component ash2 [Magnaporthiopsis poae ATCC 64411]|uniref:SET1 complex component ash2 n=1 Tax=Magnaporthiopsis poae (strain ATCC 64411 / 73-15) TaxID=644358 RepID=A0A0C4DYM5_MAGP6|nr:SET1 complex component ash2 [Magnaporthiopsis poae ATCC 64411]